MELSGFEVLNAFKKNCPLVRFIRDEELELVRLINVAIHEAKKSHNRPQQMQTR